MNEHTFVRIYEDMQGIKVNIMMPNVPFKKVEEVIVKLEMAKHQCLHIMSKTERPLTNQEIQDSQDSLG